MLTSGLTPAHYAASAGQHAALQVLLNFAQVRFPAILRFSRQFSVYALLFCWPRVDYVLQRSDLKLWYVYSSCHFYLVNLLMNLEESVFDTSILQIYIYILRLLTYGVQPLKRFCIRLQDMIGLTAQSWS